MARLDLAGPKLKLPDPQQDPLDASAGRSMTDSLRLASTLRVIGGPKNSEFYLVQGGEQRTVGRVLDTSNTLVLEGLPPGPYELVQELGGKLTRWPIQLSPGPHSFDVRAGGLE